MARILLVFLVVVEVMAGPRPHAHQHHKFRSVQAADRPPFETKVCSHDHEEKRQQYMDAARCGAPKEVFVPIERQAAHEMIIPGAVWVKRCVGLCTHQSYQSSCIPLKTQMKYIPVRILNGRTNKERCATYAIEEHVICGCCEGSAESCSPAQAYDPRKCACRCPNKAEKRQCRNKRNQTVRWNRSKCACEEIPQVQKKSS